MRRYLCACIALVAVLAVAGCGGSKGQAGNAASNGGAGSSKPYTELRWGELPVGGPIDIDKTPTGEVVEIESLAVQGLMQFRPNGSIRPGLASSVEQPNPTTYVYHLRSVKFSDGKPMTSADVVYSLDLTMNGVENWTKSEWTDVASITAPSSTTVTIKLKKPSAYFPDIVAFSGQVVEKASTEKVVEKEIGLPGHMLIGTGPWKIDSYTPNVSAVLSRNPYWAGPQPPAEKITIDFFKNEAAIALALRSGAIDGTAIYQAPKNFAGIPGTRQLIAPGIFNETITINTEQPPLNDVHVRRAIAYATNTKGMIDALYPGGDASPAHTISADSIFADLGSENEVSQMLASLPQYEYNLTKAKQELARSAYPHGFSSSIEVLAGAEGPDAIAQILSTDLSKIGINAKVDELTAQAANAWNTGGLHHFAVSDWGAIYPDPENLMSLILNPAQIPGLNEAKYRNPEVDKLRAESGETLNKPKRLQLLEKLFTIVNNDVPYRQIFTIESLARISEKYAYPGFGYWTQFFSPWAMNVKLAS